MALAIKRASGTRFLFDIRGFWADERVDGGIWPADGRMFRIAKSVEHRLFASADHVVTLTEASIPAIRSMPAVAGRDLPITVIPTCADLELFRPSERRGGGPFVLGHIGSFGTWYLPDELLAFFKVLHARTSNARLMIVNRGEHSFIRAKLAEHAVPPDLVTLTSAAFTEVPQRLAEMTAGSAIIKPVFSKLASAPTKLGEYLGCGLPCVGNHGVGDVGSILEKEAVGAAFRAFNDDQRVAVADRLMALTADEDTGARCRATAERLFSLQTGVARYRKVYATLFSHAMPPQGAGEPSSNAR